MSQASRVLHREGTWETTRSAATGTESFSATAMDTTPVEISTILRESNQLLLELVNIFDDGVRS